jgi:ATP-dependent DNA ligase
MDPRRQTDQAKQVAARTRDPVSEPFPAACDLPAGFEIRKSHSFISLPTGGVRVPYRRASSCLPTSAPQPPSGDQWLHEIKHDGFRVIARKNGMRVFHATANPALDSGPLTPARRRNAALLQYCRNDPQ